MIISLYSLPVGAYNQAMRMRVRIVLLSVAVAIVSFAAAAPVARVISTEPVNVDGILGPARNFVPLSVGDEITTDTASAVVQFHDGSTVTLQPHSKLLIERKPSGPFAHVVRGSAIYGVTHTSSNRMVSGAGMPMARVPSIESSADSAAYRGSGYETPAGASFLYRGVAAGQHGVGAPRAAVFIGNFASGGLAAEGTAGPQIVSPNGVTINLTATVNPTTGATSYVVSSIQQTITTPGGGTAVVTVTSGPLIGTTVTGLTATIPTGAPVSVTFTPPGSTTPLTPGQAAANLQTGIQQGINTGVANGTLPTGTQPPAPVPVTTGQFSASAP